MLQCSIGTRARAAGDLQATCHSCWTSTGGPSTRGARWHSSRAPSLAAGTCDAWKHGHIAHTACFIQHRVCRHIAVWASAASSDDPHSQAQQDKSSTSSTFSSSVSSSQSEATDQDQQAGLTNGTAPERSFLSTQSQSMDSGSDSDADGAGISRQAPQKGLGASFPTVPWGIGKIVQVMVLWLLAYIIIGQVAVPVGLSLLGLDRDELGVRGHAVLHLCLDLSQLAVTIIILWQCLKQYRPREKGLFPLRWQGTWPLVVLAACLVFPGVDWIAQQSMSWFPVDTDSWASHMEASLSIGDWITNAAYFGVVSVCAPIWEEAIFRGFLLTSLLRYMAPGWAVAACSLLFAMCHFRLQTFLPLLVLGVVFSLVFLFTRNLLPPMVLHSAWNVFVLTNILLRPG